MCRNGQEKHFLIVSEKFSPTFKMILNKSTSIDGEEKAEEKSQHWIEPQTKLKTNKFNQNNAERQKNSKCKCLLWKKVLSVYWFAGFD